jgi:hypothetical protein
MNLTLTLSGEEATVLRAKAAAEGLSLDEWMQKLAQPERPLQTGADIVLACMREVPSEVMATMPTDGASQHHHYIYG